MPGRRTLHGLRYTAATVLRELGLEWPAIAATPGHRMAEMMRKYSERSRLAARAIARLDAAERQNPDDRSAKKLEENACEPRQY